MSATNVSDYQTPSQHATPTNIIQNTHHLRRRPEPRAEQINVAREHDRVRVRHIQQVRALCECAVRVDPVHRERVSGFERPERGLDVTLCPGCGGESVRGVLRRPRGDCGRSKGEWMSGGGEGEGRRTFGGAADVDVVRVSVADVVVDAPKADDTAEEREVRQAVLCPTHASAQIHSTSLERENIR